MRQPCLLTRAASCATLALLSLVALAAPGSIEAAEPRYTVKAEPTVADVQPGARVAITAQLYWKGRETWSRHPWTWTKTGGSFAQGEKTAVPRNTWIAPARGGRYTIRVSTHRASRRNQWATVTVNVKAKTRNLRIEPMALTLTAGQTAELAVTLDGKAAPGELRWTRVSGGTMEGRSTFRAGQVAGNYTLELTDTVTGKRAFVQVSITAPRTLRVKPATVRLLPRAAQTFEIEIGGEWSPDELIWSRVEGGYMERWNRFRAGADLGTYTLELTDTSTGQRAQVKVRVGPPEPLKVVPVTVTLRPGERKRFQVTHDGPRRPDQLVWTRVPGGRMVDQATFEAGRQPGVYSLELTDSVTGQRAYVRVTVERPRRAFRLEPAKVRVRPGERVRFQVRDLGDRRSRDLYWSRIGGGFLIGRRTYLAGQTAGRYTLTLRDRRSGLEASAVVVIETTRISRITAEPRILRLAPGEQVQLSWQAWDARNQRVPSFCTAKIIEGKAILDPWGRLTAGDAPGTHIRVRVTEPRSRKTDIIDVYVTRRRQRKRAGKGVR